MESSSPSSPERVEPRFGDGPAPPPRERVDPAPRDRADARFDYAGFWQRAVALLIDWLIVVVIAMPIIVVTFGADYFSLDPVRRSGDLVVAALVGALIVGFWRYCGATPGKLAVGIKIVDAATGGPPTTMRLIIRLLCYFVSAFPLYLGFLWAAFDRRKQGWHDKIAGTVVIQEPD
ncbi:MAG TPA: RDD family protein [Burkholderiales bacterium]|nr:RDD family protein [Burkholderiales bacterium]